MIAGRPAAFALQAFCVAAVLALDLRFGREAAVAALYALPVLLPRVAGRGASPGVLAFVSTALVILGFYVHGVAAPAALLERGVALGLVWTACAARARADAKRRAIQSAQGEVQELARRLERSLRERDRMLADSKERATVLMSVLEDLAREGQRRADAEASLSVSRARARSILDNAPDAIITVDGSGRVTAWNPAAERFGWTEREALGRRIDELIAPPEEDDGDAFAGFVGRGARSPLHRRRELLARNRAGERLPVEVTVVPVRIGDGYEYSAFVEDVSERMRWLEEQRALTERLQTVVDSLQASNAELEKFAYVASHDLQTPLRSVAGFAQILEEDYAAALDEQGREHLRRIVAGVERMQTLIQALLAYSRLESRQMRKEDVDLERVLDEALMLLEEPLLESGAVLSRSPLPHVRGDHVLLVQVFQNLIGNAIKYRRAGRAPEIAVGARAEDGGFTISVRDDGIGIDPRHHERIFEIFRRLHGQGDVQGTGIGLAVCRRVAALHQGRIWVESELGHGAEFLLHLPGAPALGGA